MSPDQGSFMRTAAVIAAALFIAGPLPAQTATAESGPSMAPVPFAVGEELVFHAKFGVIPAGSARMRVEGIDTVRGRAAYHVVFAVDGGVPFFRVHDRYESWIDVATLSSLRHRQDISEGRYSRKTTYEIMPETRRISGKTTSRRSRRSPTHSTTAHSYTPSAPPAFALAKRGATTATSCRTATRWS